MDKQNRTTSDLYGILKSWFPQRSQPDKISRDFWMPDHSCRVCYECDSGFTIFNRRHHCRLCGRIFCGKCTANFIPTSSDDPDTDNREAWEKIRVCDFCFKLWEQGEATSVDNDTGDSEINASCSPSADSYASSEPAGTAFLSTASSCSVPYQLGRSDEISENSSLSPYQSTVKSPSKDDSGKSISRHANMEDQSSNQFQLDKNRIEYEDHNFSAYRFDSMGTTWSNKYYNAAEHHKTQNNGENLDNRSFGYSAIQDSYASCSNSFTREASEKGDHHDMIDGCEVPSSLCAVESVETEPVDFENNGLLWIPPEPENEEDEREPVVFDDDDGDGMGEWGSLYTCDSFDGGDHGTKDPPIEDRNTVKNVVDGHFRALVSQLLQVENLPLDENNAGEDWLEIVTSLSLEASAAVKPDLTKGGGMDPVSYVKVKCLITGHRFESKVIKGVVCKKNVAHRRMATRLEKPRVMILGGALEYQRVSNLLSSVDTLLKQETDHLKMAVAKIDAHHPDVLLVEKSVSRFAQEYILEKGISLVLNVKRSLLDRISRCTGAQIVPSVDHLLSHNLGYCDAFHVEKYLEMQGSAGQGGKMITKTLMYFEDCPNPLGCTILLRGPNGDELKKVKHVIQYGVFAAYHLGLETSFLADEGASLPEFSLKDPITVALPNQSRGIGRSISLVPSLTTTAKDNIKFSSELILSSDALPSVSATLNELCSSQKTELAKTFSLPGGSFFQDERTETVFSAPLEEHFVSGNHNEKNLSLHPMGTNATTEDSEEKASIAGSPPVVDDCVPPVPGEGEFISVNASYSGEPVAIFEPLPLRDLPGTSKEVSPSCSDHQSIVVSLSSRCVWKGTECEKSHPLRIKYYGSFDKPLGRFLQDHLFDQGYRCNSCEMPSEAHVQCYTHRQGTLTISVKKLLEILLPGEIDGKVWMWHRCLRCPRTNGFPPATRRIVMSDAAWGLSFGKFLELSFSNHAAASRVASCGHSLHRDCLRFFGCGKMVACFRYTSIDVHSVFLPPSKLDFEYGSQDWIKKEVDEVVDRAEAFFSEVLTALSHITAQISGGGSARVGSKIPESRLHVAALEEVLHNEKIEFEEALRKCLNPELREGQPVVNILEINRLRRQLLFQSYMWDHRLVYASSSDNNSRSLVQSSLESIDKTNRKVNVTLNLEDSLTESKSAEPTGSPEEEEEGRNDIFFSDQHYHQLREDSLENQGRILDHAKLDETVDLLETGTPIRRALSDSHFSFLNNLSDTLDAAWTGESRPGPGVLKESNSFQLSGSVSVDPSSLAAVAAKWGLDDELVGDRSSSLVKVSTTLSPNLSMKSNGPAKVEGGLSWFGMPFLNFYRSINKNFIGSSQKLDTVGGYNPVFVSSSRESELQSGARLLLPVGVNDTVIPVYDDEPTSIISYALVSEDYHKQLLDEDHNRSREIIESSASLPLPEASSLQSFYYANESVYASVSSIDDSLLTMSASQASFVADPHPLPYSKSLHLRVSFSDNGPHDQVKYTVTCYCARQFEALRRICCPSELDFVRSLSRCKKWGAQGGKSKVFFAKTLDERFIIKQVTKTELESFIKSAPAYFAYLTEAIGTKSPTSLAKIVGMYQVVTKHLKGGKETKMDILVMENLLFGRQATRIYDLKGSSRCRYNPDASGTNSVLLDQNLIEAMPTSPIFVGTKAKLLLERAVWNDTAFLASVDVMDYSLLVGIDETKHELIVGIIDFMRQYTWDKHLETWAKASGILGGPKNASPTVISPQQYKKRFRKAMTTYFLKVQDDWAPPLDKKPSTSNSELFEESLKAGIQRKESESNVYIT